MAQYAGSGEKEEGFSGSTLEVAHVTKSVFHNISEEPNKNDSIKKEYIHNTLTILVNDDY